MTLLRSSLVALTLAVGAAHANAGGATDAALATVNVYDGSRIVVDCRDQHLPSLRSVATLLETNNSGAVFGARERLLHTAHRECARGHASVVFVRDASSNPPALAMVDLPSR